MSEVVEQPSRQRLLAYWLLAGGVAVLGTAAVIYLYSSRILTIAGPFVVLAWLPMLLLLRSSVLPRQIRRRTETLTVGLARASELLDQERSLPWPQRRSAASDAALGYADLQLKTARGTLDHGQLADAAAQTEQLGQLAADWDPDAPLTRAIQSVVKAARKVNPSGP